MCLVLVDKLYTDIYMTNDHAQVVGPHYRRYLAEVPGQYY